MAEKKVAVGFDIETASAEELYSGTHEGPFIRLMGTKHGDWPEAIGGLGTEDKFVAALNDADAIYGHNIFRFDLPALARHAGADYDELAAKAWDTAVLARLIDPPGAKGENPPGYYGLDALAQRYGHAGKSDDLEALALRWGPQIEREGRKVFTVDRGVRTPGQMSKAQRFKLGLERIPADDLEYRDYLRGDLEATAFVRKEVFSRVSNWAYAKREMKVAAIQNRMTLNGWGVNRELLAERRTREDARRSAAVEILADRYGVPLTKADGKPSDAPWATLGGRAALEAAFEAEGAPFLPRTGTGALAVGKDPMGDGFWVNAEGKRVPGMKRAYGHLPTVVALCDVLADATGASAKYAEIERYVTAEGRVHAGIGEDQASGRFGMTKPSVTNIGKRGDKGEQRAVFDESEQGRVHIACDLAQVDMRAIAGLSQDRAYMALFEPGRDAHMDMAEVYFGERTKTARYRTKAINHGLNYGQSAQAVASRNGLPLELVQAASQERARAYPRLIEWTREVRELGAAGQLLDNGFGRLMRCDPQRAYTQAPALMGQGAARDLMCAALLRLVEAEPTVTQYLRAVVHDELVLAVPEAEVDRWSAALESAFTFEWKGLPILCDVSPPGLSWHDCYAGE
jgi:DNA polymerase-1